MKKKLYQFLAMSVVALCLGGCFFEPREDPTRFYILKQNSAPKKTYDFSGGVQILNVDVPAYLKKNQIITLDKDGTTIDVSEFNRWAATLDVLISGTFASELSARLPKATVLSNTPITNDEAFKIYIVVSDCIGSLDGELIFKGHWLSIGNDEKIYPFSVSAKVGAGYASYAEALSKCIADVSDEMAKIISTSKNK